MTKIDPKLLDIYQDTRLKSYPSGQIIIYAGDPPTDVYIVKSGYIKVYDIDDEGREKILSIIKPGDIMPYAFFSGTEVANRWFYQTIENAEVYVMERAHLVTDLEKDAHLLFSVVNNFSSAVHDLLRRLSSLSKTQSPDKLIAFIEYLVHNIYDEDHKKRWWEVPFPVNQQFLADITGITRESCSTAFKELVEDRLVRSNRVNVLEINVDKVKKMGES